MLCECSDAAALAPPGRAAGATAHALPFSPPAGFKALLEKRELGMEDTWAQVERRIEFEPEFKELSKTERLDAFIEVMEDLAARENERLSEARRAARREARKARDAFRALLESLAAAGRIHARMRWGEALTIVEEESYEQCCRAKEGSRPKELFEDMVLGMEEALDKQRMVVKRVMRAFGVSVEAGSTFEGYRAQLQGAAEEDAAQRKRRAEGGGEEGVVWVGERSVEEELDRVPTLNLRVSAAPVGAMGAGARCWEAM